MTMAETAPVTIDLTLISHTNAGKTTLARTLLGRDIGEVRDAPHVTEEAEVHPLLETEAGDLLRLTDTPGFGDTTRLLQRLRFADNPIGWLMREMWDRYRDRPLWCSQQAVRAARDSTDVVLYLVNAAEDPRDAGYVVPEMQVLGWVGKPIVVLLNQIGAPVTAADEEQDIMRWRSHLAPHGIVADVLAFDAFARCWVQERVLLDTVERHLPGEKRAGYQRLLALWSERNVERFSQSMHVLAEALAAAAADAEPIDVPDFTTAQRLLAAMGVGKDRHEAKRTAAMAALATRLDAGTRAATERLITLHGLHGQAAQSVLQRLRENYAAGERLDEGRAALWGSIVTGALTGLKADLVAGGLTLGAGMLVGGVIGGLTGVGVARGYNKLTGREQPQLHWSDEFLAGFVRASLLRYLAVAHFGRGRGRYVEGEAPAHWKALVAQAVEKRSSSFKRLWPAARETPPAEVIPSLQRELSAAAAAVLEELYPGRVPASLKQVPN
jgi:hypothetical protein